MPRRRVSGPPYATLLEDPDLRRWYENVSRGSPVTADVYLRRLGAFCDQVRIPPGDLPSKKEKSLHDLLLDFISSEERREVTGSYIDSTLKAVKSWLLHHGRRISLPLKVRGATEAPTLADERVPTPEELKRVFLAATPRDRVCSALMAHSGVRPQVLGNYAGDDGLRLQDLPDLVIKGAHARFERTPAMVSVRASLSKAGHRYFSFIGNEACEYVSAYLDDRLRAGEKLSAESDLVHPRTAEKAFLTSINVGDSVRTALRAAGFKWRPYVLRGYFDTQLLLAESRGKVAHDYRVFWMGHKGSMEARYTTNKGRLPQSLTDDMRDAYARCEPFLSTAAGGFQPDVRVEMARVMLGALGYTEKDLAAADLTDPGQLQDLVKRKVAAVGGVGRQEVVDLREVQARLQAGWTFVTILAPGRAILSQPSTIGAASTPGPS